MKNCFLKKIVNGELKTFSCDEVRELHLDWKKKFRQINHTDERLALGRRDKMYEQFCEEIDDFLNNKCECDKIELKCSICKPENHEGYFCRCENRNIRLAKQLRNHKIKDKHE